MTSLNGRFKNHDHEFKNQSFDFKVTLKNYKLRQCLLMGDLLNYMSVRPLICE